MGKLSPHIYVDSKIPTVAKNSEETLNQEIALACHLGLVAITFKLKGNIEHNMNLARIIFDKLAATPHFQVNFYFEKIILLINFVVENLKTKFKISFKKNF